VSVETYILSFRSNDSGGSVVHDGRLYKFDPGATAYPELPIDRLRALCADKDVLFFVHGFNVRADSGRRSANALEQDLRTMMAPYQFTGNDVVIGVLWPGDWHVKVVNYSWEFADATEAGRGLRRVIENQMTRAASISMVSHSLGARVVLAAAQGLNRKLRTLCLTAAAADEDCLTARYEAAAENAEHVYVLRSKRDRTLQFAYPAGDFLSDIFGDEDSPFRGALGRHGPRPAAPAHVRTTKIPSEPNNRGKTKQLLSDFDHTDYFPSSPQSTPPVARKSDAVSRYVAAAFAGMAPHWR
jgi:pimeloyl-ACP methyl ester carboxylesterase